MAARNEQSNSPAKRAYNAKGIALVAVLVLTLLLILVTIAYVVYGMTTFEMKWSG